MKRCAEDAADVHHIKVYVFSGISHAFFQSKIVSDAVFMHVKENLTVVLAVKDYFSFVESEVPHVVAKLFKSFYMGVYFFVNAAFSFRINKSTE